MKNECPEKYLAIVRRSGAAVIYNRVVLSEHCADPPFLRGLGAGCCYNLLILSVFKSVGAPTLEESV